jgi:hypothetical protein
MGIYWVKELEYCGKQRNDICAVCFCWYPIRLGSYGLQDTAQKIEQINAAGNAAEALTQLNEIFLKFLIAPLSVFCAIQGIYFLWLAVKTMRAGVYPPPGVKMPFRTKVQTGLKANITAITSLFAGVCNFAIIAVLLMMRHEIFKHI